MALGAMTLWAGAVAGQSTPVTTVVPTDSCPDCSIVVSRAGVIQDGPEGIPFSDRVSAFVRPSGEYVVRDPLTFPQLIMIFDRDRELVRSMGRDGDGPGEFRGLAGVLPSTGSSLWVYDRLERSLSQYDEQYRYVDRRTLPASLGIGGGAPAAVVFPDGMVVMNAIVGTPTAIGYPLHLVDTRGSRVRSFGKAVRSFTPENAFLDARVLAPRDSTTFWAVHTHRYEIELWERSGRLLKTLERDVDWFPPLREGDVPELLGPRVWGVFEDEGGLLWVFTKVLSPEAPPLVLPEQGAEPTPFDRTVANDRFDTIIEVIDPRTGELLATRRVAQYLVSPQSGVAMSYEEGPQFEGRLIIWRVSLDR